MSNDAEETVVEEEVEYVEEEQPYVIETGDFIKVKQILDESVCGTVQDAGLDLDFSWENVKMFLMFISCVFAMVAQFYPLPFPESRLLLAVCCASYFILSTVLQIIVTFIDKDTILFTKPNSHCNKSLEISTSFPRFQEYFHLSVKEKGDTRPNAPSTTGKMYIGKYFTAKGEYDEYAFVDDARDILTKFVEKKKFGDFQYSHKMD